MLEKIQSAIKPSRHSSLARPFYLLGWAGFWLQLLIGSLPVVLMVYYFTFTGSATVARSGLAFIEYLTIFNLLSVLFTTFWSYRYTRLSWQLVDPERRPSESSVTGTVWTGVIASAGGMLLSMIVLLLEAANLLFYFLKAPQGGIPVIQTSGVEAIRTVSAVDMVSLVALILILFVELIVLVFSLWLLFRTSVSSPEYPQTAETPDSPGGDGPAVASTTTLSSQEGATA